MFPDLLYQRAPTSPATLLYICLYTSSAQQTSMSCDTVQNSGPAHQLHLSTLSPVHSLANICLVIEKAREFQKNIYFCFIDYAKAFDCVDHNKLWKILKEMGITYQLTCLLRNLYAGQEATVRTGHGTTDSFQIGKGVHQGCVLSPCLFNLYA